MTLVELKALAQDLGFNDNLKIVLLVAKQGEDDYEIVACDADGKLITTTS